MQSFERYNPIAVLLYFAAVIVPAMTGMNPVMLIISLFGSVLYFAVIEKKRDMKAHLFFFLMFIVLAFINPFFYHNGKTVLFVVNDTLITLEALVYGIFASAMISSVLYWSRSFSLIMTEDKLLYVFGKLSPKFALVLSMAIRYIPLMARQTKKVEAAQRAMGIYKEENIADTIKGKARIFSIMTTWALENGIITADSMAARGYGDGRRTNYSDIRFGKKDALLCVLILLPLSAVTALSAAGAVSFVYYPAFSEIPHDAAAAVCYAAYLFMALLPTVAELTERIKWKYLISKI